MVPYIHGADVLMADVSRLSFLENANLISSPPFVVVDKIRSPFGD